MGGGIAVQCRRQIPHQARGTCSDDDPSQKTDSEAVGQPTLGVKVQVVHCCIAPAIRLKMFNSGLACRSEMHRGRLVQRVLGGTRVARRIEDLNILARYVQRPE